MTRRWWLLPGTLCSPQVFEPVLDALAVSPQQRRPVRLDRPAVENYADELAGAEPEDVVLGFSLGAIVAAHHADRIRAGTVVLLAANPFADAPQKRAPRLQQLADIQSRGAEAVMSILWPAMVGPAAKRDSTIGERIVAMAKATVADLPAQTKLAQSRPGAEPMLAEARARILFVTGREDQVAPPAKAEKAAAIGAHALTLIDGAGHFLPLEAPRSCAEAIARFLQNTGSCAERAMPSR